MWFTSSASSAARNDARAELRVAKHEALWKLGPWLGLCVRPTQLNRERPAVYGRKAHEVS